MLGKLIFQPNWESFKITKLTMLAEQTYIRNVNYLKDTEKAARSDRVAVAYLRYLFMYSNIKSTASV